jgi:tetratricopeptide (TPR) repeat protein
LRYALLLVAASTLLAQNLQTLTAQIQRTPTAALFVERGTAYLDAGDAKQAIADFDRALEQDATHLQALTLRARAYSALNRHGDAITDLSGALALAPGDAALYLSRSRSYAASGDAAHAQQDRAEALRLDPDIAERMNQHRDSQPPVVAPPAVALPAAAPKVAAAPASARRAAPKAEAPATPPPAKPTEDSTSAEVHYQRGRELIFKNKHAEGRAELNEALRLDPRNPVLYNTLGFSFYSTKDHKRAIELFNQAIEINPNYLNAIRNRALAKRATGDLKGYEADHRRELELAPAGKNKKR